MKLLDSSLLTAIIESYKQAAQGSTRKKILSVMADKLSFKDLEKLIPGLSRYRFTATRRQSPSGIRKRRSASPKVFNSPREGRVGETRTFY